MTAHIATSKSLCPLLVAELESYFLENMPAAHPVVHEPPLAALRVPSGHALHLTEPSVEKLPTSQEAQLVGLTVETLTGQLAMPPFGWFEQ